jgi:hypothetical protein
MAKNNQSAYRSIYGRQMLDVEEQWFRLSRFHSRNNELYFRYFQWFCGLFCSQFENSFLVL